jgi:uncharacterized protein (TIGR02231 family)
MLALETRTGGTMPNIAFKAAALAGFSVAALLAAAPTLAATIETSSRVDAVTVYPDAAQVTRVAVVEIPAGANSILLKGLPMSLDPASIRVEGTGSAPFQIGSVESRVAPVQQEPAETSLNEKLRKLIAEREITQARIAALQSKKTMIERYAQASPEKLGDKAAPLDVEKWASAWDAVGEGLAKLAEENQTLRMRLANIEQEIRAVQSSNRAPTPRNQPSREVTVDVEAQGATKAQIVIIYRVSGAGWQPLYDARLESKGNAKPTLQLVRRAQVSQRTGEDWSNIELSVSTVRAQRGTQAPDVLAQRIKIFEPPPIGIPRPAATRSAPARQANEFATVAAAPPPAAPGADSSREEKAREMEATVEASAYEAQFRIPGRIDVPGDGASRSLRIGSQSLEPTLMVRASPSIDPTAYLEVSFTNKEDAPILPGEVNIQRDGTYVGRGAFKLVAPGEDAKLGFGADERIKITRVPLSRRENTPGWLGANRTERQDFRTTVRNLHPFAVKVGIVDRIPISEDTSIVIEPLSTNTAPTEKSVEERRGVMGWTFELAPNASREIRLGWQLRYPKEKQIVTETLPDNAQR